MSNLVVWSKPKSLVGRFQHWRSKIKSPAFRALETNYVDAREELRNAYNIIGQLRENLKSQFDDLEKKTSELDNILSSLELPMVMVDRALRVTKFNRAAHLLFSISNDDIGFPITQVRARFEIPFLNSKLLKVMEQGEPQHRKISDQQMGSFKQSIVPFKDVRGQICGAIISFTALSGVTDLTDKTLESPALFRAAQRMSNIGSFYWAIGSEEVHWSDQLYTLCGQQHGAARQTLTRFIDSFCTEDRAALRSEIATALQYKRGFAAELHLVQPDGSKRAVQIEALYQRASLDDRQAEILMGLIRDISTASSDTTAATTDNAGNDNREHFNTIGQPVAILDMDGIICSINKAATSLFGYSHEELAGMSINALLATPRTNNSWFKPLQRHSSTAHSVIDKVGLTVRHKNGGTVAVDVSIYTATENGKGILVATLADMSAKASLKKQLTTQVNQQTAERDAMRHAYLVAYDDATRSQIVLDNFRRTLDAPLSIIGDLGMVIAHEAYGNVFNKRYKQCGADIVQRVASLKSYSNVVGNLLKPISDVDFSDDMSVNLRDAVAEVVEAHSATAHQKEISLGVNIMTSLPDIRARRTSIDRILGGMMDYALEAAQDCGNITVHINEAADAALDVALRVSSSTFSDRQLESAFEGLQSPLTLETADSELIDTAAAYERIASTRLALAQRISQSLGGNITLTQGNNGAFTLTLQITRARVIAKPVENIDMANIVSIDTAPGFNARMKRAS